MLPFVNLEITLKLLEVFDMKTGPSLCEINCQNTLCEIGSRKVAFFKYEAKINVG